MVTRGKDWRIAAFGREEVGEVDDVDELEGLELRGEDDGREDEDGVRVVDKETVPGSVEVKIWLECADSNEEGTGVVDVNSGTGESNDPLIPSSLRWVNKYINRKIMKKHTDEKIGENAVTGWEGSDELIEVNAT